QTFKPHHDGAHHRFRQFQASELTFLIYLNDDFTGGSTNFYRDFETYLQFGAEPRLRVRPVRGTALVFRHRQLHEGGVVESGRKYVLRTDVMYGPPAKASGQSE
ncbi:MAG TPA: 2OG-Fe(II) oxygenase, partial [Gemmata sp.]